MSAAAGSSLAGKLCVITGATSGIGLEAAEALAGRGAELILIGRDERRGRAALERIRRSVPGARLAIDYADLQQLGEVRRLAEALRAAAPRIDILINNAGAIFDRHALTGDGLERTFALNHMSYFLLTLLLLERLRAAPSARIVSTASEAHRGARLDFADLAGSKGAKGWPAYRRSKLANIFFTRALARRLHGSSITANCLHPGFVRTDFGERGNGIVANIAIRLAKRFGAIGVAEGAATIIHLAAAPEVAAISGRYFSKCQVATPSPEAQDDAAAERLWEASLRIAGLPAERG